MKISSNDKILIFDKNYKKIIGQVIFEVDNIDIKQFMKIFSENTKYHYFLNEINRKYLLK